MQPSQFWSRIQVFLISCRGITTGDTVTLLEVLITHGSVFDLELISKELYKDWKLIIVLHFTRLVHKVKSVHTNFE